MRGSGTSSTVVLVDGVRIGSATAGQAEFEALSVSQIDRIEVLRGPASGLYGADGVGGVVQIFTRRGEGAPRVTGAVAIGGYGSRQGDLGVSGSRGAIDYAVSVAAERSDGVSAVRPDDAFGAFNPDDDGFSRQSGSLRLGYAPAPGHRFGVGLLETRLTSQYDSVEYDADFNPDPRRFPQSPQEPRRDARLPRRRPRPWTTSARSAAASTTPHGADASRFRTERDQATAERALVGPDSNSFSPTSICANAPAATPSRRRRSGTTTRSSPATGRFLDALGVQADVRRDDNSAYGGNTTGRLGLNFEPMRGLKLRALAGTTFRAPTFNDLFYPDYGIPPGTDGFAIRPERGRSFEIGATWESGDTRLSVTAYRSKVKDLIGYEPDLDENFQPLGLCPPGYPFGCARNIGRARMQGLSLAASRRWGALELSGGVELLDATDSDTGYRLNRRAAHQESLAAS